MAPRNRRDCSAYSSRPTASFSVAFGRELAAEELRELVVGDARGVGVVGEITGEGCRQLPLCGCGLAGERREEAGVGGVARDLRHDFAHLALRGHDTLRDALAEGRDVAVDRAGKRLQSRGDDRPVVGGRGRHQVEDRPELLRRGGDHVEVAQLPLRVAQLELEFELAREVELRDDVDVVGRSGRGQRRERLARLFDEALVAGRALVAEAVVELEPADVGREARLEFGEGVDPRVGDRVDLRGGACCVSHDFEPMELLATRQTPISGRRRSSPRRCRSERRAAPSGGRHRPCLPGRSAPRHPTPPARPR